MQLTLRPAIERGRQYAFPAAWAAVLATGVAFYKPLPSMDVAPYLSFVGVGSAYAHEAEQPPLLVMDAEPAALMFVRHEVSEPDDVVNRSPRDGSGAHGRFAAPGNAVRRHVQVRAISPRTADELAGFFRDVSYTLTDIRQGEAVPPYKVDRVPADLGNKDGNARKMLFITALLPVILEVNQRVLADREQLLYLRDKLYSTPQMLTAIERIWLDDLADRYDTSADKIDELVRRVDIVPPSMAIAQGGVESGWGTSFAARTGNALYGQIQAVGRHSVSVPWKPGAGMPQPFADVGESTEAYITNLNTHPAYAGFRNERAAMRARGEAPDGFRLIGSLLRYSERGQEYVQFVRQIMRENDLRDFDKARLSGF
ncbi:glucosaminidase domain-containing protein [uncultured Reyranella sp.]|uniref:glucosaminidase domain-containing protein n=1 Tax=uncultured Reyranella sp. TaxID=735512 RepID=UPI00259C730A|nr:glucosaminidase domain-containing protein [uncultured Reyranella sp.]